MLFSSPITRQQVPISEPFGDYHVFREPYTGVQFTDQWLETTQERTRLLSQYDITPISIGLMQVLQNIFWRKNSFEPINC